ncbi:MAG TPA: AraC family transcriptional regulator [Rhodothermales bacterium]|nr:AraC family transcriptional regulator [Rhodothermales bacterium]
MNMQLSSGYYDRRKLEAHVENRTVYSLDRAELNVYETHMFADKVELTFDHPVLVSMLRGKKVMHLRDSSFVFVPGESVVLPPGEEMQIDFPEATVTNPTQCLALTLANESILEMTSYLNEQHPKADDFAQWTFTERNFHFTNDTAVNQIIARMIFLFTENHPSKDIFADFMLKELILRLMQTEARHILLESADALHQTSRLAYVVKYIREHLHEPLTVQALSEKACMSQTHFHRCFKLELGLSPVDFINSERIRLAKKLLKNQQHRITEICYSCGFNSISYFNNVFRRATGHSPTAYRRHHLSSLV